MYGLTRLCASRIFLGVSPKPEKEGEGAGR